MGLLPSVTPPASPVPLTLFSTPMQGGTRAVNSQQSRSSVTQGALISGLSGARSGYDGTAGVGSSRRAASIEEVEADVRDFSARSPEDAWMTKTADYRAAAGELLKMNPDSFSITQAEFLVENAFMDNTQSFEAFSKALQLRADLVRQVLKKEGIGKRNDLTLNYGIQQLFSRKNLYTNPKSGQTIAIPPIHYDFDDIMGEKDYTKLFVTKALARGSGQCHSMPLLYLMIAEQLGAKAWLSMAPQHSYIQFEDKGRLFSFETTNGNLVSNTWMMESGFVTTEALKHDLYLDTLSQRKLYAQVLADLLLGYLHKFGSYDRLAEDLKRRILQLNPDNLTALIVDANLKTAVFSQKVKAAGQPKEEDLPNFPDVYKAWQDMNAAYAQIDNLGFQDMPKQAYQDWLKSIDAEKEKQALQAAKDQMQNEIHQLQRAKVTIHSKQNETK